MRSHLVLVLATLATLCLVGCSPRQAWEYSLATRDGKALVDTDRVALVFEGVAFAPPAGGATGSLVVAGSGTHRSTVRFDDVSFESEYTGGTNTMKLEGYTFTLRERGKSLQIGAQEFDLRGAKQTIVVAEDGTAQVAAD